MRTAAHKQQRSRDRTDTTVMPGVAPELADHLEVNLEELGTWTHGEKLRFLWLACR